ncbi:HU family DNA-binding protein [Duganella vulcania]|uniref:Integration host factor subunit alpha n=1 Tax=Duganella vulcania TaxID=2692166 RepID=A0A845GH85_9BURK|nr:HU family DNA-binding protein [Duganella vulcania]MYM92765.1 hypothetical protein [Duganella vulcania]
MNKRDLANAISEQNPQLTKRRCNEIVDIFFNAIANAVANGKHVQISGFGTFVKVPRKAKVGKNPATGEDIVIEAHNTVKFTTGKALKEQLNAGKPPCQSRTSAEPAAEPDATSGT